MHNTATPTTRPHRVGRDPLKTREPLNSSSHDSSRRCSSPDPIPAILTSLRVWLRQSVSKTLLTKVVFDSIQKRKDLLRKSSRQRLLTTDLLAADKRIHCHRNSTIDILRSAVFGKTHLAERFADTHDGFQMTDLRPHN